LGRKRVGGYILENYEEWKKRIDAEVLVLNKAIEVLKLMRDATVLSSFPFRVHNLRVAKKQPYDYEDKNED